MASGDTYVRRERLVHSILDHLAEKEVTSFVVLEGKCQVLDPAADARPGATEEGIKLLVTTAEGRTDVLEIAWTVFLCNFSGYDDDAPGAGWWKIKDKKK